MDFCRLDGELPPSPLGWSCSSSRFRLRVASSSMGEVEVGSVEPGSASSSDILTSSSGPLVARPCFAALRFSRSFCLAAALSKKDLQ